MRYPLKKILTPLLAAVLVASLVGCSFGGFGVPEESSASEPESQSSEPEPPDPNWPAEVSGVTVDSRPETVISLSPALTETIGDMGLLNRLAAVSDYCDWPAETEAMEKAGTVQSLNYEVIDRIAPQYILAQSQLAETDLLEMQQRNIEVVIFPACASLDEFYSLFEQLSLFFEGKEAGAPVAEEHISLYKSTLDEISASALTGAGDAKKTAAYIRVLDSTMATHDSLEGLLLSTISLLNLADSNANSLEKDMTGWNYPVEDWKDFSPQILFVNTDVVIRDLENNANYKGIKAVLGDAVYQVDMDVFARGGLRMLDILRSMAATAYPDSFSGTAPLSPAYPSMYKEA